MEKIEIKLKLNLNFIIADILFEKYNLFVVS